MGRDRSGQVKTGRDGSARVKTDQDHSARFYLNFPTGKLFGKLSFLQNFSGGAHSALKHRYITLQPKEIILELSGSKIL